MSDFFTVLSLGAGVQSTTVALMMKEGVIPWADAIVFADTGAELPSTYYHLNLLKKLLSPERPFLIVQQAQGLKANIEDHVAGRRTYCSCPPLFTSGGGLLRRQCTRDFKVIPILRKCQELRGGRKGKPLIEIFGISVEELGRVRSPDKKYIAKFLYPLLEMKMTRRDCKNWLLAHGYPIPARSACVFCPYRCNVEWERMRSEEPAAWIEACRMDELMRHGIKYAREACFVHRSLVPLSKAKIEDDTINHFPGSEGWGKECEGMCGV